MSDTWMLDRFDESARAALELALREAFARGSNHIALEDIERGIARQRKREAEAAELAKGVGG